MNQLLAAVDAAQSAIVITDLRGVIRWANPAFGRLTGYLDGEVVKSRAALFELSTLPAENVGSVWSTILPGGVWEGDVTVRRKDGSKFTAREVIVPVRESAGEIRSFIAIVEDVTPKRRAEQRIRESEESLRAVLESCPDPILLQDAGGRWLFANRAWVELLGLEGVVYVGCTDSEVAERVPDLKGGLKVLGGCRAMAREGGRELPQSSEVAVMLGRRTAHLSVVCVSVALPGGKDRGVVTFCRDVTAPRETEVLREQLWQSQKMQAMGALAGGIAHDFNNILGAIMGFAGLAREDVEGDPTAASHLDEVLGASLRAKELVQQILAFSRNQDQRRVPLLLGPIVSEGVKLLRATLPNSIRIDLSMAESLPPVLGNATQLQQVIMNLGVNAAQAMQGGTRAIELRVDVVDVEQSQAARFQSAPGRFVRLCVRDTGHGIPDELLGRIFDPFFTTKARGQGTGLGLSVVHGIVQAHQGFIDVRSRVGEGTEFGVHFPVHGAVPNPSIAVPSQAVAKGRGERVLLVDDERALIEFARCAMQRKGYVVTSATDPEEALRLVGEDPYGFDVVVTDLAMPSIEGVELARRLHEVAPELPILLVSGHPGRVTPEELALSGILEVVQKPYTVEDLCAAVQRVLAGAGCSTT